MRGRIGLESLTKGMGKGISRLQYQALGKATGAVQGTQGTAINQMAGVEDVVMHLDRWDDHGAQWVPG